MIQKKIVFTIVACNYYGLAKVLRQSVLLHHDDVDFFIFIADGIPDAHKSQFGTDAIDGNTVMQRYISLEKLLELGFKYNLTEFCTAIKPFCFQYLFDKTKVTQAIYLDPDIFVFSPLTPVFESLETASIVLTPHIVFPSSLEGKRTDSGIMATGIFNLGFAGVRRSPTGTTFLRWWSLRLLDQCFIDSHDALFTDQKWVDFVPALFPKEDVFILRYSGTNLAPWNFHERKVIQSRDGQFMVQRRIAPEESLPSYSSPDPEPLVFVHFSGFDYKRLCSGEVTQSNIEGLKIYSDLQPLIENYMTAIKEHKELVLKYLDFKFSYGSFADGSPVITFHRRLFRSAVESGQVINDPFATGNGSFHKRLKDNYLLPGNKKVIQFDKSNKNNLRGMKKKLVLVNKFMRLVKRIIGFHNYVTLLRLMRPYSRPESQLHLIDRSINKL